MSFAVCDPRFLYVFIIQQYIQSKGLLPDIVILHTIV